MIIRDCLVDHCRAAKLFPYSKLLLLISVSAILHYKVSLWTQYRHTSWEERNLEDRIQTPLRLPLCVRRLL